MAITKSATLPLVSIISTNFNHGRFLKDTIESVRNQTYGNIEHIIVDGGSTDETLELLKQYPHVQVISEKDEGSFDAFCKGLNRAKGKYVMQCAVTDGYVDKEWVQTCVSIMEQDAEVSLVWGLPQQMTEEGVLQEVVYPQFRRHDPPQKQAFLSYWLSTFFWFPEGNFCARKNVFEKCFPRFERTNYFKDNVPQFDPWLEINYHFHRQGYLSYFVRTVANFGRVHHDQKGQVETAGGINNSVYAHYVQESRAFRRKLMSGEITHRFVSADGAFVEGAFQPSRFRLTQWTSPRFIVSEIKHLVRPFLRGCMRYRLVARLVIFMKRFA